MKKLFLKTENAAAGSRFGKLSRDCQKLWFISNQGSLSVPGKNGWILETEFSLAELRRLGIKFEAQLKGIVVDIKGNAIDGIGPSVKNNN